MVEADKYLMEVEGRGKAGYLLSSSYITSFTNQI